MQFFTVAQVIDIGESDETVSSHTFNFSDQDRGYVASHKAYGTESYKPNRNWTLTLTSINTTYLEIKSISYDLISKEIKPFYKCPDYLSIETWYNRTKFCQVLPEPIYLHLDSNNTNVSFTFRTDSSREAAGFWISLKGKLQF